MSELLSFENLTNLLLLLFLQAVLGFDNLLYIALESRKAPADSQVSVRRNAILMAIGLRIVLLFVMLRLLESFETAKTSALYESKSSFSQYDSVEDPHQDMSARQPNTAATNIVALTLSNIELTSDLL